MVGEKGNQEEVMCYELGVMSWRGLGAGLGVGAGLLLL